MTTIDKKEFARALQLWFQPGDVFEIRVLKARTNNYNRPHTESGYFDYEHIPNAANMIESLIEYAGVYVTLNPVDPVLLARVGNHFASAESDSTTSDVDIRLRRWLPIDCDPVRKAKISSSDTEHELALAKAREIRDGLASLGWPEPVFIDSGNGAQLTYRIDLPANDNGLVKRILKALEPVSSDTVKVDQSVFNPARIWRIPGTMNRKGEDMPPRSHRMAKILELPESIQPVPTELLEKIVAPPTSNAPDPNTFEESSGFNIDQWISQYAPDAGQPMQYKDGRKWVFKICPFNSEHDNRSAVLIETPNGAIGFRCLHDSCSGNDWHRLREMREPGCYNHEDNLPPVDFSKILEKYKNTAKPTITVEDDGEDEKPEPTPWRSISNEQVETLLQGTTLGEMATQYSLATIPPLPLEVTLPKAIVSAGCALSEPKPEYFDILCANSKNGTITSMTAEQADKIWEDDGLFGTQLAKVSINTAGGQACNIYAMIAAQSGTGKDIGNLLDRISRRRHWLIGTNGSAEGIAEGLTKRPNGLIAISEFTHWVDERHWQHNAAMFLTETFNKGYFRYTYSSRGGKKGLCEAIYCFPNIMANIQPQTFESIVNAKDISSGFLGRFLYTRLPENFLADPAKFDRHEVENALLRCVDLFRFKEGVVEMPDGYGHKLSDMFRQYSPQKLNPVWRRLVNEYMPRFAVMLSLLNDDPRTLNTNIIITDDTMNKAEILTQWFFKNAEQLLMPVEDLSPQGRDVERIMRRLTRIIAKYDHGNGVTVQCISHNASHTGTTAMQRRGILCELVDRGWITSTDPNCIKGARFAIKNPPPGVLA